MNPENTKLTQGSYETYWLLTGVKDGIDLRRMSTSDLRDFPQGVSGSHMAAEKDTCFLEVPFDSPPEYSYLLRFKGDLKLADYRSAGDASFSGQFYSDDHGFSQEVFIQNSGQYAQDGCDGLIRYSAAAMKEKKEQKEVFGLFPSARDKLSLQSIEPLGDSPPIQITFCDGSTATSDIYYK